MRELFESIADDFRYAVRGLRARPGFALVASITLALGIGATTAVFSAVNGVFLRSLPYPGADRLFHVGERDAQTAGHGGTTSHDNFVDWRRMATSFEAMGLYNTWQPTLTGHGDPERIPVAGVTAGMFDVFHIRPMLGRAFTEADNLNNAASVAVISYDFWQSRLGGDPSIVGQNLMLNFTPVQVVGVMPRTFSGPRGLGRPIWVNFSDDTDGRAGRSKNVYALLEPGVTMEQAQADMAHIGRHLADEYPKDNKGSVIVVETLTNLVAGDVRRPLYLLFGASLFVLLIACANLSNLLLARGIARRRELAVRAALGANRQRLVRQLLTESLMLALIGTIGGVAIAVASIRALTAIGPDIFNARPPVIDGRVLVVASLASIATTLVFGLVPALRGAPRDPQVALRSGSRTVTDGSRTRVLLAVVQLSLAVVLLSTTALVTKSLARVLRIEPGIRGDHLFTASLTLPRARYDSSKSTVFYRELERRIGARCRMSAASRSRA